ncbi:MAG: EMC3/TMCO1 family protein [Methanobacterium sp.]
MVLEQLWGPLNAAFNPFVIALGPILAIVIIAIVIALITSVAQKFLVDQDRLISLQKEMKEFQQEMMEARKSNDQKALDRVQKNQSEFMSKQREMMTMSFKPMIVTFLPIIIIFWWISQNELLNHLIVYLPTFAYYVLLVPLFHMFYHPSPWVPAGAMAIEWLGWYILCSFGFSFLFRKLMGIKSGGGM